MTKELTILNVWIGNLKKYNAGELCGVWINMCDDIQDINATIDELTNCGEDEYIIADYSSSIGLTCNEYANIDSLKELVDSFENLSDQYGDDLNAAIEAMTYFYGTGNPDALKDCFNNHEVKFYYDCYTMSDVAFDIIQESGRLEGVPDDIAKYFDYESYGRDLDIEGRFYYCGGGVYAEIV